MRAELEAHWEVVAEGAQTILRAAGVSDAYDQLKSHCTRKRNHKRDPFTNGLKIYQLKNR